MKATIFLLLTVVLCAFVILNPKQPEPLIEQSVTFQPIVENIDLGRDYWYIRTIKVYYFDYMPIPVMLSNKDSLVSYCTDSTSIKFISSKDTLVVYSVKRMSCVILAVINLKDTDISFLKNNALRNVLIRNIVTDNALDIQIKDTTYFKRVLKMFEGKSKLKK